MAVPITDLDAERSVISACLANHADVSLVLSKILPTDFFDPLHRAVFGAMAEMDGTDWDVVRVARELRRCHGDVEASKAIAILAALDYVPSTGTVLGHASAVGEASANRKVVTILKSALAAAESKRPAEALEIAGELANIGGGNVEALSLRDMMLNSYNIAKEERAKSTLTWGHYQLDNMTGGLRPGFTGVIAGGSSQGKSSEAIAVVDENKQRGARCLIVSLEDGREVYGNRFLARRSGVNATRIRDHKLEAEDHSPLTAAIQGADTVPFFLHYENTPWERIAVDIDRAVVRDQIDLVVLDYIQECWCETRYQSRQLELQAVARRFRGIMRKRHRSGIILSQVTGSEPGKPPTKEMVRECKDITNGAEQIIMLYTNSEGVKMANLDKSKDGTCGIVTLKWNTETASYERVLAQDVGMEWANERYDGFEETVNDIHGSF